MAEPGEHDDLSNATDIGEHVRTWKSFTALIKWNLVAAAILMLLLLIFRTHA